MIGDYLSAKHKRVNIWPTIDFNTKKAKHEQHVHFGAACGLHSVNFSKAKYYFGTTTVHFWRDSKFSLDQLFPDG
jgi:hypothetical protein